MRVADKPVGRVWRGSQGEEGLLIVVVVVVVALLLLLLLLLLGEEDIDSSSTSLAGGQDDEEGTEGPERPNIGSLFSKILASARGPPLPYSRTCM